MTAEAPQGRVGPIASFFGTARALLEQEDAARGTTDRVAAYRAAVAVYQQAERAVPSVVVVGETGRGKSTLVNALLGRAEASPTGPGETTGTYLAFEPASDDLPDGVAEIQGVDGSRLRLMFDELAPWVRIEDADLRSERSLVPLGARVGWSGLAHGATIVDTPGSGGLNPDHARIALARAAHASVLLMVTDAFGVLTESALGFLERCSEHIATVVVVVTKIDAAGDWAKVVADDERVLRSSAVPRVRDARVVAVSAAGRLRALSAATSEVAERRFVRSRFGELEALLDEQLSLGDLLDRARAVGMLDAQLRAVARTCERDGAALGDAKVAQDTEADRRRLSALRSQNATWRLDLDQRIGMIRFDLMDAAQDRLQDFGEHWQCRVDRLRWRASQADTERMHAEMSAELFAILDDIDRESADRLAEAITTTVAELGLPVAVEPRDLRARRSKAFRPAAHRRADGLDLNVGMVGLGGVRNGLWIGTMAAAANAPLLGPFAAVGAVGAVALHLLTRGQQLRKRNLEAAIGRNVGELRGHLVQEFDRRALDLRPQLVRTVERAISAELEELTHRLQLAHTAAAIGDAERRAEIERLRVRGSAASAASRAGVSLISRMLATAGPEPTALAG